MASGFFSILHTNDLHGKLDESSLPFLLALREGADLYFDSGDGIKAGNLAVPLRPEFYWEGLRRARCTASTLGNRESHVLKAALAAKTAGLSHPVVVDNLQLRSGGLVFPASIVTECKGLKVGVVGTMVAMVTPRMATAPASQYLWSDPVEAAIEEGQRLKGSVDVLVLLSHVGYKSDVEIAKAGVFDFILGGHSHTVIPQPELHGSTWIAQGGSHARFAGVYQWDMAAHQLSGGLVHWLAKS